MSRNTALALDLAACLIEASELVAPREAHRLASTIRAIGHSLDSRAANALPSLSLPSRPRSAPSGSAFLKKIENLRRQPREQEILRQILSGNVPSFQRTLKPVTVRGKLHGEEREITFFAMVDFLSIGTDADYVRIPMMQTTARKIALKTGTAAPTAKMVEILYRKADIRMIARPWYSFSKLDRDTHMATTLGYQLHERVVQKEIEAKGGSASTQKLIAGHKKNIVLPYSERNRIAFYGFFKRDGTPWQGKGGIHSLAHPGDPNHVDYSHGLRLVSRSVMVDHSWTTLKKVLADPILHRLIVAAPLKTVN